MIAIIDYGMGNLRSVQKAFEYIGHQAVITQEPKRILSADKVVLPGVGAFADAMGNLRRMGLIETIEELVARKKPLLGICLGMQLFFEKSCEGGFCRGLSLIPGEIKKIPQALGLKVPHMGWNLLSYKQSPLFEGLGRSPYVYFVHSYYLETSYQEFVIGTTRYGKEIPVAVNRNRLYGVQFHPEKSGEVGLKILKNFGGLKSDDHLSGN